MPRITVRNTFHDYDGEVLHHNTFAYGDDGELDLGQGVGIARRHSTLAGLTRGTTQGRVDEWRRHVGDD